MSTNVHTLILGVDQDLDAKEENLDIKKLEQEFANGLGTVFSEIGDVEIKTNDEIAKMTPEEFLLELKNLEKQYDDKVQVIAKKQIAKELEARESKKNNLRNQIQSLKMNLSKLEPNSSLHDSYQSSLDHAKKQLESLEA